MVIWTDGNRSDYFLPLENLVNHLNGKYCLSPRPSSSPCRPLLTTLKNRVPSELDYVKKKINRKKLREYTKIWTMIILANNILGDVTSFIRFSIFQAFYNVCAFPLKSDVNFLNIDTFILICHVFTLTLKIYTRGLEVVFWSVAVTATGSQDRELMFFLLLFQMFSDQQVSHYSGGLFRKSLKACPSK